MSYDGCAIDPLDSDAFEAGPGDDEEQRRYHTALLRAFTQANAEASQPWISGIFLCDYRMMPNSLYSAWISGASRLRTANLNGPANEEHLQNLIKVFFRDVPLVDTDEEPTSGVLVCHEGLTETLPSPGNLHSGIDAAAIDGDPRRSKINAVLTSPSGSSASVVLQQEMSPETVPIHVRYVIEEVPEGIGDFVWNVSQGDPGVHYELFPSVIEQGEGGRTVEMTLYSNRPSYIVELLAKDAQGQVLRWSDTIKIDLQAGDTIYLGGLADQARGAWSQRFAAADSLLYGTGNTAEIREKTDGV